MLVHSWLSRNVLPVLAGLGVIVAATPLPASAQHAAHEHGVAWLSAALEGGELLLEFLTPLDNLVGFEHAPTTAAQHQALADAAARLREGGRLFVLPEAAACVQRTVEIEAPWLSEVEGARGHDHDHDHEHEHEHEHEHGRPHECVIFVHESPFGADWDKSRFLLYGTNNRRGCSTIFLFFLAPLRVK